MFFGGQVKHFLCEQIFEKIDRGGKANATDNNLFYSLRQLFTNEKSHHAIMIYILVFRT